MLEQHEGLQFSGMFGTSASKLLLIMAVMTLHSAWVSALVLPVRHVHSTRLAIHSAPDGLAICLVDVPRSVGLLEASMWAVIKSLPQLCPVSSALPACARGYGSG